MTRPGRIARFQHENKCGWNAAPRMAIFVPKQSVLLEARCLVGSSPLSGGPQEAADEPRRSHLHVAQRNTPPQVSTVDLTKLGKAIILGCLCPT